MSDWIRRLHHDLVRPFLWRARDLRDDPTGSERDRRAALGAVLDELYDDEGQPIGALASWQRFAASAPAHLQPGQLGTFATALARTVDRLRDVTQPLAACLTAIDELAAAFGALAEGRLA